MSECPTVTVRVPAWTEDGTSWKRSDGEWVTIEPITDLPHDGHYMLVPVGSLVLPPCNECGGDGVVPDHVDDVLLGGPLRKPCPSCGGSGYKGAERRWLCDFPEAHDDHCYPDHPNPQPDKAAQPRKHTTCGWVLVVRGET